MFGLRLEDDTRVCALYYKPMINHIIYIDSLDKWYEVTMIVGRIAYARIIADPRR